MKKIFFIGICVIWSISLNAQIVKNIDECSPYNGDFAAVKTNGNWGFINKQGEIVIDYRNDLVALKGNSLENKKSELVHYPIFSNGRCLIKNVKEGVNYYGFINEKGDEIIKPTFLNATNFSNGYAIVIVLVKDSVGYNAILKKPIHSSYIEEYVINTSGELIKYLYNPKKYTPSKYINGEPLIESKFLAPNLVAVKNKEDKWDIHSF